MPVRSTLLRVYFVASYLALGLYLPFFPSWLEGRGITGLAMGAIVATIPAMGLLGPPLFGALADALGRTTGLLRIAASGAFGAFAVIAVTAVLGRSLAYGELFALASIFAFFRAPMTMLADVVALDLVIAGTSSYGRFRLWGSLGFLAGAIFGGRFIDPHALAPLPVAIAAGLLAASAAAFTLPTSKVRPVLEVRGGVRLVLANPEFRLFLITVMAGQAAHCAYDLCFTLVLHDRSFPPELVGVAWALGVVAEVALMATSGALLHRANPAHALAFALGAAAIRWALIAVLRSPVALLIAQPLHGLSWGLFWLSSIEFVRRRAPRSAFATAQGIFVAATSVGAVAGLLAWGALYRAAGGELTFAAASLVAAIGAGSALLLNRAGVRRAVVPS